MERDKTVPTVLRLLELSEIFQCEVTDLLTESSQRAVDQAKTLENLLNHLSLNERVELLNLVERMVKWKKGTKI